MRVKSAQDVIGGIILVGVGAWLTWYCLQNYNLGTLRHMGSGMLPVMLGVIMAGLGAIIVLTGLLRHGPKLEIKVWSPLFVLTGIAAFALMLRPFGLLPAIVALIVISSFAELKIHPISLIVSIVVMTAISYLVFGVVLGLPLVMLRWPL